MRIFAALAALLIVSSAVTLPVHAAGARLDSPAGLWQPLDSSGKPEGLIRIFEVNGLYYGRIEPASPTDDRNARCTHCTGKRHNQPIIGLVIMRHLKPKNGEYVDGDILDPNTGHVYDCSLRLTDGGHKLIMRGFFGISLFGRSQTWLRVADPKR
ncbi:MAG: DUF2147 domain-containing protein [Proteobacteria bacterium]|nr:DUF2147 domain-containing protein [Pseudomonadota bacterium]